MKTVFRRPEEHEAYVLLHEQGWEAFDEKFGALAHNLLNHWLDLKIARLRWSDNGGHIVRTFKKYAY